MRDFEIELSDEELRSQKISIENLENAKKSLAVHGFVALSNLFTQEEIALYRELCIPQVRKWLYETTHAENGQYRGIAVGNYRLHHPLMLEGGLNTPNLYANFAILKVCKSILGSFACLGSMAVVSSFPGADKQRVHCDSILLYPERVDQIASMPPFSFSVSVPLAEINCDVGGTKFIPGSHRYDSIKQHLDLIDRDIPDVVEPLQNLGSCVIWDVRTQHFGAENKSKDVVRPLVYFNYQRPWYRDSNVFFHPAFMISEEEYKKIPTEHLPLFEIFRETQGKWKFDSTENIFYPNRTTEIERLKLLTDHFERLDKQL